jgi:ABC-type sulfate transport system permease subunit
MLATNTGSIVRIDYPAPPSGRAAFLMYSLANPNSKSVTYADQGNVYWASNGVFTTTARAMGKYGRVSVANLGASKYEALLIATNSVEIGYP